MHSLRTRATLPASRRMWLLIAGLAAITGCDKQSRQSDQATPPVKDTTTPNREIPSPAVRPSPAKPTPPNKKAKAMHPIKLDWDLVRTGDTLRVTYTVHNTSSNDVFLLDRLTSPSSKGMARVFDRAIVQNADTPGTVSLIRGYVAPAHPIGGIHPPVVRRLKAGETVSDQATIPLPLAAWHNFAQATPLQGTPTSAVLEVGYLEAHDKWVTVAINDGTTETAPGHPFVTKQKLLRSAPKPIPGK